MVAADRSLAAPPPGTLVGAFCPITFAAASGVRGMNTPRLNAHDAP